ncbi:MAG: 50S ribosomal protein L29 [Candidatus Paceibacterota bacterium]
MKKKNITIELRKKSSSELTKEAVRLRREIAERQLEFTVNPPKDLNEISKLKKRLAVALTILRELELQDQHAQKE